MKFGLFLVFLLGSIGVLFVNGTTSLSGYSSPSTDEDDRVRNEAFSVLARTKHGSILIEQVKKRMKLGSHSDVLSLFQWGDTSRTDSVLTRKFNLKSGEELRERVVSIVLKKGQDTGNLVLDIAHELAHAAFGPNWDPYDPDLTAGKYVRAAIEGRGGELDAIESECIVGSELGIANGFSGARCYRYLNENGGVDREIIKADLYKVGKWKHEVIRLLGLEAEMFPLLSNEKPSLFSSSGKAPYPIALAREFLGISRIACENSRKRLSSFPARAPAFIEPHRERALTFVFRRCDEPR